MCSIPVILEEPSACRAAITKLAPVLISVEFTGAPDKLFTPLIFISLLLICVTNEGALINDSLTIFLMIPLVPLFSYGLIVCASDLEQGSFNSESKRKKTLLLRMKVITPLAFFFILLIAGLGNSEKINKITTFSLIIPLIPVLFLGLIVCLWEVSKSSGNIGSSGGGGCGGGGGGGCGGGCGGGG